MAEVASGVTSSSNKQGTEELCSVIARGEDSCSGLEWTAGDAPIQYGSTDSVASARSESVRGEARRQQICFDFTKGTCTRGETCKFSHDVNLIIEVNSQERGICFDYLRQSCSRGALCRFSHDLSNFDTHDGQSGRNRNSPICYDFVKKQCTRGAECRYSHDLESIMNSTRGRQPSGVRHYPQLGLNWGLSPQQMYHHSMAMAALAGSLAPLPGMLAAHMPGLPGMPLDVPGAGYGAAHMMNTLHASQYARGPSADVTALQTLAAAAADPRTGHLAQAQILQQMQAMLAVMQQHPGLAARPIKGMGFGGPHGSLSALHDPYGVQAHLAHAASAASRQGPAPAVHSPALAGVAQQLAASAVPQQVQSTLNAHAASYPHNPATAGAGAVWKGHPQAAKAAEAQRSNDLLYARQPEYIPAAGTGPGQADPSLYMSNGLHAAAVPYPHEDSVDSHGAEGAESISGSIDLPRRCSSLQRDVSRASQAAVTRQQEEEDSVPTSAAREFDQAVSGGDTFAPLLHQLSTSAASNVHAAGLAGSGKGEAALQHPAPASAGFFHSQLHTELPAIRTASPRSLASVETRLSHPNSPLLTDHASGSASHSPMHSAGALVPPESTFAEHAVSSPRSPMSASLASMKGLSTAFGDGPMTGSALPRHLSMDATSMRHIGLGQSTVEASRLGAKHRQSSLGPGAGNGVHLSNFQDINGSQSSSLNGLPSLGHATSLSDGLQHLNICQHIWRRT